MVAHARMVREARAAFASGEFGRAADWLQRSIAAAPQVADGHLLLAQAWIALGKYLDAAAEIHRGVQLDRTWPVTGPPVRELYGPRQADFHRHLQQLVDAAAAFPHDAALRNSSWLTCVGSTASGSQHSKSLSRFEPASPIPR